MHDKNHPDFVPPENENAKIWRYMDYPKFISLLDKRALFFSKIKAFDDPYEGTMPKCNRTNSRYDDKDTPSPDIVEAELERRRRTILVTSWYINEYESAAMWDLYSKRDAGVAIRSTYRRLSKSLDANNEDTVYIGKVQYVDFDTIWISLDNIYKLFHIKRKSFEHEQELRAIRDLPSDDPEDKIVGKGLHAGQFFIGPDIKPVNKSTSGWGKYVPINLGILIEKIYVAPLAPDYFYEAVISVDQKFGLDKNLFLKSDLYSLK